PRAQNIFLGSGGRAASRPGFVAQPGNDAVCKTSSRDTNNCEIPTPPHRNAAKGSFATCAGGLYPLCERRSIPCLHLALVIPGNRKPMTRSPSRDEPGRAKAWTRTVSMACLVLGSLLGVLPGIRSTNLACGPLQGKGPLLSLWRARLSITVAHE